MNAVNKLRPDKAVQKILISTTSRPVGEYVTEELLIAHAWPDFRSPNHRGRWKESPISRSAFIFAFEVQPVDDSDPHVQYYYLAETVCAYLCLLFGKRFDCHGVIEESGYFHIPELSQYANLCNPQLPQNSHIPRIDFEIPLNLVEVSRIAPLFFAEHNKSFLNTFRAACKFYAQSLQIAETDTEIAYLHLITAGEILSNYFNYEKEDLIDDEMKQLLVDIRNTSPNGAKYANVILGRLMQIKKRFAKCITSLIDDAFFTRTESKREFGNLTRDSISDNVSAAYDLRSKFVHTGIPFGNWVTSNDFNNEIQIGKPVVEDKEYRKILASAPTYVGLERIIRYCLLQFAQQNGAYIEPIRKTAK